MDAFNSCFSANKYETEIQADFDLGQQMGVSGTPTVFVNGRRVGQANSVASYPEIVDGERDRCASVGYRYHDTVSAVSFLICSRV